MNTVLTFLLGAIVGGTIGYIIAALMNIATKSQEEQEK